MPAQGVSTPELRFRFVRVYPAGDTPPGGEAYPRGPGTLFPVEASKEHIEYIYFKAEETKFTSGSVGVTSNLGAFSAVVYAPTGNLPTNLLSSADTIDYYYNYERGYCAVSTDESDDVNPAFSSLFGVKYSTPVLEIDTYAREIADNERALWIQSLYGALPDFNGYYNDPPVVFEVRTAFYHAVFFTGERPSDLHVPHSVWTAEGDPENYGGEMLFIIGDVVGFEDIDGTGNPLSPANKLYPSISFSVGALGSNDIGGDASVGFASDMGVFEHAFNLVIEFSGEVPDLIVPVYFGDEDYTITASSDFTVAISKYFPYAKGDPAVPVWDDETGEPA